MVMSGYAIEGHQDLLRLWMPWVFDWTNHREACLNVMKNYAMGRHIALVEEMILSVNASATGTLSRKAGMLIRKAICGYLEGGHFDLANEMMSRTSNHVEMIIDILKLYKLGYLERGIDKNVLRIMAFTDLYSLRKVIANHYIVNTIRPEYLAKSARLNRIMHEYKVGYEAAQNLLVPKSYFWLLKGLELVGEGVITAFVFNKITSYLLGCADYEVCRIAETANEHTYIGASRFLLTKYQGGLFSHMQLFDGHKKLDDNYRRQNKVINRLDFSKANSRSSAFS